MREIKFRARNSVTGDVLTQLYMGQCFQWVNNEMQHNIVIEQFTGRKSEDDVDIYDGDLVALIEDADNIPVPDLFQVKWSDDGKWIIFRSSVDFYDLCDYDVRVIGNIHQNPELLES